MLEPKMLKLREMEGKQCIAFVYDLLIDEQQYYARCYFRKLDSNTWQLEVWEHSTSSKSNTIYCWYYTMPKDNMPLTTVCAFGLKRLQMQFAQEVQIKSQLDFTIGNVVQGVCD